MTSINMVPETAKPASPPPAEGGVNKDEANKNAQSGAKPTETVVTSK